MQDVCRRGGEGDRAVRTDDGIDVDGGGEHDGSERDGCEIQGHQFVILLDAALVFELEFRPESDVQVHFEVERGDLVITDDHLHLEGNVKGHLGCQGEACRQVPSLHRYVDMEGCLGGGFRLREGHLIAIGVFDACHVPVEVDLVCVQVKIFEDRREIYLGVLYDISVGRLLHRVDNTKQAAGKDARRGVDNQRGIGSRKQFFGHVLADGEGECLRIVRFDIGGEGFGGDCRAFLQRITDLHTLAPGRCPLGSLLTHGNADHLASR